MHRASVRGAGGAEGTGSGACAPAGHHVAEAQRYRGEEHHQHHEEGKGGWNGQRSSGIPCMLGPPACFAATPTTSSTSTPYLYSYRRPIQRIGPTEFSSGAGSTAGLQRRRGENQQDQQADR
jgi:hypothetical protein